MTVPVLTKAVAAVALLRHDGALLLQHRDDKPGVDYPGVWSFPSGAREPGETIEDCAKRELREETGYQCDILHRFFTLGPDREGTRAFHLTVFWALFDEAQRLTCREGQDLKFVQLNEIGSHKAPDFLLDIWLRALLASLSWTRAHKNLN